MEQVTNDRFEFETVKHLAVVGVSDASGLFSSVQIRMCRDREVLTGADHLFEHIILNPLLTQGNRLLEHVTSLGGYMGAFTTTTDVSVGITIPSRFFPETIEELERSLDASSISQDVLEWEKEVARKESYLALKSLEKLNAIEKILGLNDRWTSPLGQVDEIASITASDVLSSRDRLLTKGKVSLVYSYPTEDNDIYKCCRRFGHFLSTWPNFSSTVKQLCSFVDKWCGVTLAQSAHMEILAFRIPGRNYGRSLLLDFFVDAVFSSQGSIFNTQLRSRGYYVPKNSFTANFNWDFGTAISMIHSIPESKPDGMCLLAKEAFQRFHEITINPCVLQEMWQRYLLRKKLLLLDPIASCDLLAICSMYDDDRGRVAAERLINRGMELESAEIQELSRISLELSRCF